MMKMRTLFRSVQPHNVVDILSIGKAQITSQNKNDARTGGVEVLALAHVALVVHHVRQPLGQLVPQLDQPPDALCVLR